MAQTLENYSSHFARLEHCLQLRREGRSYQQIADRVGLKDEHAAQRLISKAILRVLKETAEEVRSLELSRLELLISTLWEQALLDVEGESPDFRRFDRVKQLLETKLKFCGAQAVLDGQGKNQGVTIVINSFTKNTQINGANTALVPVSEGGADLEAELALLLPDDEKPEPYD